MKFQFQLQMPEAIKAAVADSGFRVKVQNAKDDAPAELQVMDDIGEWGVAAPDVSDFLAANKGRPITAKINSFGGDVYAGLSIANDLSHHDAEVTTIVNGVAYSAATPIFLAGDVRKMHEASDFGIHRAWSGAVGNQNVMLAMAEWLETIDNHIADLYAAFSDESLDTVNAWLDGKDGMSGTVFSAKEALEAGFASEVIPAKKPEKKDAPAAEPPAAALEGVRYKCQAAIARLRRRRA